MNNIYRELESDTDVLLFNQDTYLVCQLKELLHRKIDENLRQRVGEPGSCLSVFGLFSSLSVKEATFYMDEMIWTSVKEGIKCQILKVASTGWQTGRLRLQVTTKIFIEEQRTKLGFVNSKRKYKTSLVLEFCPDEPTEPESPLDDIRKMIQAT